MVQKQKFNEMRTIQIVIFIVIINFLFVFSCTTGNDKDVMNTETVLQNNEGEVVSDEPEIIKNNSSLNIVYVYENDTLIQTVKLFFVNKREIEFQLISENKVRQQKASIEGIAKTNNGDAEIDEDEEGNSYPVNEYIYESDCWLSFRIDMETQTTMKIIMEDCISNQYCPFSSVGILKKQ